MRPIPPGEPWPRLHDEAVAVMCWLMCRSFFNRGGISGNPLSWWRVVSRVSASSRPFNISKDLVFGGFETEVEDRYLLGMEAILTVAMQSRVHSRNRPPPSPSRVQAVIIRCRHRKVRSGGL